MMIAWVLPGMGRLTRAILFILPKPRVHLFCHLVSVMQQLMPEGGIRRGDVLTLI